jgi:hypothetical protein
VQKCQLWLVDMYGTISSVCTMLLPICLSYESGFVCWKEIEAVCRSVHPAPLRVFPIARVCTAL